MRFRYLCSFFLTLIFFPFFTFSEPQTIIVSASKLDEPLHYTSSDVSVIHGKEIRDMNLYTIGEVLEYVKGALLATEYGYGSTTRVKLRGADDNGVLVLLDGIPVNNVDDGKYDAGNLLAVNISRIEIVKGAMSVLYGSNAIGGVINIITQKGQKKGNETSVSYGTGDTGQLDYRYFNSGGKNSMTIAASYLSTDGPVPHSGTRNVNLSFMNEMHFPNDSSLSIISRMYRVKRKYGQWFSVPGGVLTLIPDENYEEEDLFLFTLGKYRKKIGKRWNYEIYTSGQCFFLKQDNPAEPDTPFSLSFYGDLFNTRFIAGTKHDFALKEFLIGTVGYEYDLGNSSVYVDNTSETIQKSSGTNAVFLQGYANLNNFLISTMGIRYTHNRDWGAIFSPRITGAVVLNPTDTKFRGAYSQGFRAPNFQELFSPTMGNRDLKPEENWQVEAGIDQTIFKSLKFSTTLYEIHYTNKIVALPTGNINAHRAKAKGLEGEITWNLRFLRPFFSYAYTNTELSDETGKPDFFVTPAHVYKPGITAYMPGDRLQLNAFYVYKGKSRCKLAAVGAVSSGGTPFPEYQKAQKILNAGASYKYKGFKFFLRAKNLLGKSIEEFSGLTRHGGTEFYLGASSIF